MPLHPPSRFLVLALSLAFPTAVLAGESPSVAATVDAVFAPGAGKPLPGAAVVVLQKGAVVHAKGYGLAGLAGAEAIDTRTRFRLGSVSKSFTALVVLQLVEQGRLSLDDPLEKYVPGAAGGRDTKIRHLLSHTAGLPDFMSVEEAMKLTPDAPPGERLNYSNVGYALLSRVVAKVSGQSFEARLRTAILDPLGMKSTGAYPEEPREKGWATGHLFTAQGGVEIAERSEMGGDWVAAGGLWSTADEMALWLQALLDGRIVRKATLEQATTPVTLGGGRKGAYGLGFTTIPFRGLVEFGHGGDISGFNSYYAVYPDEELAVVVLANVGMRPPGPLPTAADAAHAIVEDIAAERLGPQWPPLAEVPATLLQRYAGRFRMQAPAPVAEVMGETLEITVAGDHLVAANKMGQAEIYPESPTAFFSKAGPVRITFVVGEDGTCNAALLTLMGLREFPLTREH